MKQMIPDSPSRAIVSALRRDSVDGTLLASVVIAASLTALPLAILLATNFAEIARPAPIFITAGLSAAVAALATLLISRFLAAHVAGIMCGALGYSCFAMSWVKDDSVIVLIATWLLISLAATLIFVWLSSDSKILIQLAAGVVSVITIGLLGFSQSGESTNNTGEPRESLAFTEELDDTPNVYLFVLDGFSRFSQIEAEMAEFDVDFAPYTERLEAQGFTIETEARANYAETRLSVPSMLNASYPLLPSENPDWDARYAGESALRGDNATVDFFTSAGYEYWHSGSGIWGEAGCDITIAARCIGTKGIDFETYSSIWRRSPLRSFFNPDASERQQPVTLVSGLKASMSNLPTDTPIFFFSHMLLPHHPYNFDRNCNPIESLSSISSGSFKEFRPEYAGQALCTARLLAEAMEDLIAEDPTAIVILQADHGSAFHIQNPLGWTDASYRERIDIFRATRLPESCRHDDNPAAQSVINTLPLLQSCLTKSDPEFVEPKIIVTNYGTHLLHEGEHPDDG